VSASVNKVILIGNIGVDPVIKTTSNGSKLARFSVATNERWKDKDQNPVEKTEWHRIVVFGPKAEIAERYLKKGMLIAVEGSIRSNKWTDKDGNERESVEVHITQGGGDFTMLGGRNEEISSTKYPGSSQAPQANGDEFDEVVPF
jgi:single-strand DNA-binding protein